MLSTQALEAQNTGRQYLTEKTADRSPNQGLLPLTATVSDRDHLEVGGCDVTDLVNKFGSPLYILDEESLRIACRQYRDAFKRYYPGEAQVLYASKAWNCLAVCAIATQEGLGIDVATGGELFTALKAGANPSKIYLHGNNKSLSELKLAVEAGCTVVVDNRFEIETLASLKTDLPIRIMMRITPGLDCHTHEYIRTGHIDSKFGFDPNQVEDGFNFISQYPSLSLVGLHAHIGSQIFELQAHQDLGGVMVQWLNKAAQYGVAIAEINVGGGLGIRYNEGDDPPSIDEWVKTVCDGLLQACQAANIPLPKVLAEPGRSLIGSACVTAYTVGSKKTIPGIRTYLSVDGGMSDNPRPITYQSVCRAIVANRMSDPLTETVTIAGKHCESGDILIKDAKLPSTQPGDTLVVMATGAYNYSMSSNYNRLARPAAILVGNGTADLILQRETYEDLIRYDRLPAHLK
ncbi:diaminopimelate decarboxylase [Myxacorys almedinensis]|uniref:Diaminopimelate decarboxylase n=1 Tax=Myxacorys almedinensis A TaxID=2690445 RepID=A0A8J7Z6F5_9CYAN|nr:diaminopimelate decarboxylase [Myxacorys almedinensis]NDJ18923.1 diaminopimelate decarboxylase [Myxacorys almedinensis A]